MFSWLLVFLSSLLKLQRWAVRVTLKFPFDPHLWTRPSTSSIPSHTGLPRLVTGGGGGRKGRPVASGGHAFKFELAYQKKTFLHDFGSFFSEHCFLFVIVKSTTVCACVCVRVYVCVWVSIHVPPHPSSEVLQPLWAAVPSSSPPRVEIHSPLLVLSLSSSLAIWF